MSQHTPGPWIADRWHLGWFVSAPGDFPNTSRKTIAECREAPLSSMMAHQCGANARLIAKAPEMYEMLGDLAIVLADIAGHVRAHSPGSLAVGWAEERADMVDALLREIEEG